MMVNEDTLARLLSMGVLVQPGTDRPLSQSDWNALMATPEGVAMLFRSEGPAYRDAVGSDWDAPLSLEGLSSAALTHLAHYTTQCDQPQAQIRTEIDALLERYLPGTVDLVVELGCSAGPDMPTLSKRASVVLGIDSHLVPLRWLARRVAGEAPQVVRRLGGRRFATHNFQDPAGDLSNVIPLLSNALDPPLVAESADVVVAINLLDSVREPLNLFLEIDRILKPGGVLLLASPFHWNDQITPLEQQLQTLYPELDGPEATCFILDGGDPRLPHLSFDVVDEREVPWILWDHERCSMRYLVWMAVAVKRPAP